MRLPVDLFIVCFIILAAWVRVDLSKRLEAWVERTDWRRVDRSLTGAAAFVLFSAATVLILSILGAVASGAIFRAVR